MMKMQEHGMAQFGPGHALTKSQYAMQVAELEAEEKRMQEELDMEPSP